MYLSVYYSVGLSVYKSTPGFLQCLFTVVTGLTSTARSWSMFRCSLRSHSLFHPGIEMRANLKSISHRFHLLQVAIVWELNEETIHLPLGCLWEATLTAYSSSTFRCSGRSVCLSVFLSVCLFIHLCASLSIRLSVCLSCLLKSQPFAFRVTSVSVTVLGTPTARSCSTSRCSRRSPLIYGCIGPPYRATSLVRNRDHP